ncbi:Rho GTPase-activating 10 [Gossypium arboreum]|uniref:Rho GTPase-activating 10 n=1 Tax=Gossypium arboreum TaxID=29729 RepID=A0A0B0NUP5_GOSAR|nr:Rho GTPase-activating 10 [Gossypium arboreum]
MPKSPQNWPFPSRVILGLGRDTPVCDYSSPWLRLLNRHGRVVYPCKSCFDPAKETQPCDTLV